MKRDLIKRAWHEFWTILENLPEDAEIVYFYSDAGPLDSCQIHIMTVGIEDKMAEEAEAWGEKLVSEDAENPNMGAFTRLSFRAGTVEIVAMKFKEENDGGR